MGRRRAYDLHTTVMSTISSSASSSNSCSTDHQHRGGCGDSDSDGAGGGGGGENGAAASRLSMPCVECSSRVSMASRRRTARCKEHWTLVMGTHPRSGSPLSILHNSSTPLRLIAEFAGASSTLPLVAVLCEATHFFSSRANYAIRGHVVSRVAMPAGMERDDFAKLVAARTLAMAGAVGFVINEPENMDTGRQRCWAVIKSSLSNGSRRPHSLGKTLFSLNTRKPEPTVAEADWPGRAEVYDV